MSNRTTKPTRGRKVARAAGSSFVAASIALSGVAVGMAPAHADAEVNQVDESAAKKAETDKTEAEKLQAEKEAKEKKEAEEKAEAEAAAKKKAEEEAAEKAAAEQAAAEKKAAEEAAAKKAAEKAAAKKSTDDAAAAKKVAADKMASAQDGAGATAKDTPLKPASAEAASSETTGPVVTVKPESVGSDGVYRSVSFKLNDPSKVDYVTVNGVKKDLSDNVWSDLNGVRPGVFGAVEGVNTLVVFDALGNSTTVTFRLDTTGPVVTVKPESVGSDGVYRSVSFKLNDPSKVDYVTVNGVKKDLSDNVWSDLNGVRPGVFGAVEGVNTLVVFDALGNSTTVTFRLDTTGPVVTVKPESVGSDGVYRSVSFKLNDPSKVDYVTVNGVKKDLSDNVWSDLNGVRPGVFGAVEGVNTLVVFDALGNSTTVTFRLDTTGPVVTVKPESVGSDGVYRSVSFKLNDPSKVDYVTVNGVKKDLSDNVWSDLNGVRPGVFGAVEGVNTLVVFDALGNSTTIAFTLEAQSEAPSVEIVSVMSEGADGVHYDDEVVTITGTATKGSHDLFGQATVTVTGDNGVSVTRSPRIASDGAWSVTLDPAKMKLGAGAYQVSVTVRDTAGTPNVSEAATASFTVVAYEAPGIEITAPGHGAEFTAGETIGVDTLVTEGTHGTESVALTVTDADGVETVHVLHGAASLARSVGTTYSAALEGLEPGTYGLKATVADTTGHEAGVVGSESVSFTVKAADTSGGDEDGDDSGGDTGDDGGSGTDTDGTDTGGTDADGTDTGGSGSGTDSGSTDSGSTSGLADGGSIGDAAVVLPAKPSLQGSADTGSADTGSADTGSTGSSATPDASSGTSTGALATTGADTVGVLALIGGLLAAGLAALGFRRRKEEETEV